MYVHFLSYIYKELTNHTQSQFLIKHHNNDRKALDQTEIQE